MKTEKIEGLIGLHEDEARRWADLLETEADLSLAIEARAELAALEADNARMREALVTLRDDEDMICGVRNFAMQALMPCLLSGQSNRPRRRLLALHADRRRR